MCSPKGLGSVLLLSPRARTQPSLPPYSCGAWRVDQPLHTSVSVAIKHPPQGSMRVPFLVEQRARALGTLYHLGLTRVLN